jgi:hypothetical protein
MIAEALRRLRLWLGWDSDADSFEFGELPPAGARAPASIPKSTALPAREAAAPIAVAPARPAPITSTAPKRHAPNDVEESRVLEILDDPKLTLDRPPEDGFDPYNTGAFNRSASWEKISRNRR